MAKGDDNRRSKQKSQSATMQTAFGFNSVIVT